MKNRLFIAAAVLAACNSYAWQNAGFSRNAMDFVKEIGIGINIGNTLDVPNGDEVEWGNAKITPELIHLYKAKGFDAVRIPITWTRHFDHDAPGHVIEPAFLARVKEVVNWCLAEDMVVVINIHHDGGGDGPPFAWLAIDDKNVETADEILGDLWSQIATAFRDYDERVVFEAFNEIRKTKSYAGPDGKQANHDDWTGRAEYFAIANRYALTFYCAVRAMGGRNAERYLMIPTYAAASQEATCAGWKHPNPADDHIIATVHCYEPGDFCIWGNRKNYDRAYIQKRLDEFFPRLKRHFTDKGVPLILGEINADLRYYDDEKFLPNDDARIRWAAQYASEARAYGFPCFLWESGGKKGMGLIDRFAPAWTHEEVVDAFLAGARGTLTPEKIEAWCAKVKVDPTTLWEKGEALLKWDLSEDSYGPCWGQTMGYGNVNGNGKALAFFSSDADGNLVVDTKGQGGNMVQQQFWADRGVGAVRTYKAYVKTHEDLSLKGRKLFFTLTADKGSVARLKAEIKIPGVGGVLKCGADSGDGVIRSEDGHAARVEIPFPDDATLDANGKGLSVELWVFPGDWGKNLPIRAKISPMEIR